MKKLYLLIFGFLAIGSFAFSGGAMAAQEDVFQEVCTKAPQSTVCKSKGNGTDNPLFGPNGVLTSAIGIISIIVGIVAVIMIILGGFKLVTSGSNPQDVAKARETIIYAIVGVIIALLAQVIVQFVLKEIS